MDISLDFQPLLTSLPQPSRRECTFAPDPRLLAANLAALAKRSPAAMRSIAALAPTLDRAANPVPGDESPRFDFFSDHHGVLTGSVRGSDGRTRLLASAIDARAEAQQWADTINITDSASIVVRGFGLGHHLIQLATRLRNLGSIFVFEPDVTLLASVLSRIDLRGLFAHSITLLTNPADAAAIAHGMQGVEGTIASGTVCIDHRPSVSRLAYFTSPDGTGGTLAAETFSATFASAVRSLRTTIVTSLVQSDVTARNCIQNALAYARSPGIETLHNIGKGVPAVVVSAGPSLRRNITLLADPRYRSGVVVVAVQTTLKALLAHGIRPDYVVAIDYHEISRRFYEGLTPADVAGTTLIADPKCNPIIPVSFPGAVRFYADDVADRVVGETLLKRHRAHHNITKNHGDLPLGATVAHSAYYLCRYLGCDPVILIGQDLGFTDGQYYAPGAAIHNAWASELNECNTIEMLEWQRIARARSMLHKATDVRGRPIYTDEQMATYLQQFERDFASDTANGLTIIDATEGGVAKAHTQVVTLRDALDQHARTAPHTAIASLAHAALPPNLASTSAAKITHAPITPPIAPPITYPVTTKDIQLRFQELLRGCDQIAAAAHSALPLLARMNNADQATINSLIQRVQSHATAAAKSPAFWLTQFINQTGQLNRYKADRAVELSHSLDPLSRQQAQIERDRTNVTWLKDACEHLRSLITDGLSAVTSNTPLTREPSPVTNPTSTANPTIAACLVLSTPQHAAPAPATLTRLFEAFPSQPPTLLILIPDDEPSAHTWTAQIESLCAAHRAPCIIANVHGNNLRDRIGRVRAGRALAPNCWRGGIAGLTTYDEWYHPHLLAPLLTQHNIDAALLFGPHWNNLHPPTVRSVVERYKERPEAYGITCTQAAPGLGAALIATRIVRESATCSGSHATYGALLTYNPIAPQADPISKSVFPAIDPALRDWIDPTPTPGLITVHYDKTTPVSQITGAVAALAATSAPTTTLIPHPEHNNLVQALPELIESLRKAGAGTLHIRTPLWGGAEEAAALIASAADIISIDLYADNPATYSLLTGRADFSFIRRGLLDLISANQGTNARGWLPPQWIVPRITRRGAVYAELETFYNRWLLTCGACVIDPRRDDVTLAAELGDTIEPFPLPPLALARSSTNQLLDLRSSPLAPHTLPCLRACA
jgi:hypothetical protein